MELATAPVKRVRSAPYAWRLVATAASFALFGVGGVCLRLFVFPALRLLPGGPLAHRRRSRRVINRAFWGFTHFMYRSGVLTFEVEGRERLGRPGQLVVANHPSLIDVVVLIGLIRDANCIVKQSLWDNPCMHGPVRAAQYISNNGSAEMLDEAADALREGQTLVVFPEGTRTTPGQPPVFHRGAAAIALRGAAVVTPVVITVEPTTLTKAEPWYRIPSRRVRFRLRVGDDIDPSEFSTSALLPIASRKLNEHLHRYFTKELAAHERSATGH